MPRAASDDDVSPEDILDMATGLMRRAIFALIPLFHRDALTAVERDSVQELQDICDALLARR
jgi:hypothetical protein